MKKVILINATSLKTRVAILEDGRLMEIYYEDPEHRRSLGNIYVGVVKDILSGLGSAFVDVGLDQNLFLSQKELNDALLQSQGYRRGETVPIQKALHPGQRLIVQVKREGIGSKNPQGTTRIALPGRFWVFLPKDGRLGVSRRIEERREIRRLKRIAQELKRPHEGLIARTASQGASKKDLERDFNFLLGTWKGIEEEAERVSPPKLLYKGMGLMKRIIRDRLLEDVAQVIVDSEKAYHEILSFLDYMWMGEFKERVELYRGKRPLFEQYDVERQFRESLQREVKLEAGGTLVIEETEALTAIDVNTRGDVHHRNQEAAILNTNLEAAREIPRQLRLRKISGIIIVDFIDMKRRDSVHKVLERLKEELRKDRVTTDFIDITGLGLVEITRKREGKSLAAALEEEEEG
ncbi:MAG: Rne/Rng family ribonuclease [Candidatus Bipolaricaulia bacterium]